MKNKKSFFLKIVIGIFLITGFSDCQKDNSEEIINEFSGRYTIVSIMSSIAIDCNNDGIKSNDYLQEISSGHTTDNKVNEGFFRIDNPRFFVEARPLSYHTNNAQLIAFNFPDQHILFLNENPQLPILGWYNISLINYRYEITDNKEIKIIDGNPKIQQKIANNLTVKRISKTVFELELNKKVFDFVSKTWKESIFKAKYKKII
jgi:hypothetical protein